MGSYLIHFTVYALAMSGLIFFALFVYKKVMSGNFQSKSPRMLEIEETMNVNPRKSLMIVRAGNEHFLIASDMDRTNLISKLDIDSKNTEIKTFKETIQENISRDEALEPIYTPKKEIHLELIKNNNPQSPRLRRKTARNTSTGKMVTLDFDTPVDRRLTTMKEMAKKINEL